LAEPKQDETFRVIDRRLFTEEGELRSEAAEQARIEREQEAAKPRTPSEAAPSAPSSGPVVPASSFAAGAAAAPASAESPKTLRSFQTLVDLIARNAAAMLGGYADPQTGEAFVDLDGAREMIDMLDDLREKTRGNLYTEEHRLDVEVLSSLKMGYLEMSKATAEAMKKKTEGKTAK